MAHNHKTKNRSPDLQPSSLPSLDLANRLGFDSHEIRELERLYALATKGTH